jgi:hypothetical protein
MRELEKCGSGVAELLQMSRLRRTAILCLLGLLCGQPGSLAQDLTPKERAELQVYREKVPAYLKSITQLRTRVSICEAPSNAAYQDYAKQYWTNQGELLQVTKSAFLSQNTAGNVILGLVVLITVSGILLAAYQLYLSFKIGQRIDAQTIGHFCSKSTGDVQCSGHHSTNHCWCLSDDFFEGSLWNSIRCTSSHGRAAKTCYSVIQLQS